jgi:O-antigen/teichoic acid export membrane protein
VLGAIVAGVTWILAPNSPLAGAILGSAIAVPFLLLLWLARRMCYVLQRPRSAILGSATSLTFVLFGLYAMRYFDRVTPFLAFLLTATGSLLGATLILIQIANLSSRPVFGGPSMASCASATWRATLRENWSYGRWLFGNAILYPISGQVQMFLAAAFLGLGSAGVLRAMMLPAAVMTQVVSATDLLILPGFSYDFGRGYLTHMCRKALLVSSALGGAGLCFALLLRFVAAPAEHLLFGGKFAPYVWLMPVLALIPAVNGFNSGFSATLRGSQKPHFDLLGNAMAAPVAVLSAFLFIRWWGLAGAAFSLIAGCATLALANFCSYWHLARSTRASASAGRSPLYFEKNP